MNACLLWILIFMIISGVVFCVMFVYYFGADISYWYQTKKIHELERRASELCKTVDDFQKILLPQSFQIIEREKNVEAPTLTADTFVNRSRIFHRSHFTEIEFGLGWSECGWLLYAIAEMEGNLDYVQKVFNQKALYTPFKYVNQCQCGMVALLLFEKTNNPSYKQYADEMYSELLRQDTEFGILYRAHSKYALVDVVGMVVPFLIYYDRLFNIPEATILAYKTTEKYIQFGCDTTTGIPAFEFSIHPPYIKSGAADWGRGIAWFVIGLVDIDENELSDKSKEILYKLNSSLLKIWDNGRSFGQFIGRGGRDLSAELPIVYYLYKKGLVEISNDEVLSYSTLCHNGIMYHSTAGNHGIIRYGTPFGANVLSQAYMLRLLSLYKSKRSI